MGDYMEKYRILVKGIVQKDDKFLVVKKWFDDNISDPYRWEFIDAETEFGESPDTAVIRAIHEQTGITAMVDRILYTWTFVLGKECSLGLAYLCLTDEDDIILSEELNGAEWIEGMDFDKYINNKPMLEDLEKAELY